MEVSKQDGPEVPRLAAQLIGQRELDRMSLLHRHPQQLRDVCIDPGEVRRHSRVGNEIRRGGGGVAGEENMKRHTVMRSRAGRQHWRLTHGPQGDWLTVGRAIGSLSAQGDGLTAGRAMDSPLAGRLAHRRNINKTGSEHATSPGELGWMEMRAVAR